MTIKSNHSWCCQWAVVKCRLLENSNHRGHKPSVLKNRNLCWQHPHWLRPISPFAFFLLSVTYSNLQSWGVSNYPIYTVSNSMRFCCSEYIDTEHATCPNYTLHSTLHLSGPSAMELKSKNQIRRLVVELCKLQKGRQAFTIRCHWGWIFFSSCVD